MKPGSHFLNQDLVSATGLLSVLKSKVQTKRNHDVSPILEFPK